jgi:PAS domain S-box-containing protein
MMNDFCESILRNLPVGTACLNYFESQVEDNWLYVNPEFEKFLARIEQRTPVQCIEFLMANSGLKDLRSMEELATLHSRIEVEGYDATEWFQIQFKREKNQLILYTFNETTDVLTEKEHLNEEKLYQNLFQHSIDSIVILDHDLVIKEVNRSFQSLTKKQKSAIVDTPISEYFVENEQYGTFEEIIQQKDLDDFDALIQSEGVKLPCVIQGTSTIDEISQKKLYLLVIRNVSRRKKAERQLIQAEKLTMTGKIARTIAHEVRNPLTNLSLAVEQLKDELDDKDEDANFYIDIINRNAERIGTLISNLLNSAKPRSLNLKNENAHEIIREAADLVKDRLKLKNIRLNLQLGKHAINFPADKEQLRIALLNLLVNAIEATAPSKGSITVTNDFIDDLVHIAISDNGRGIPEEKIDELFEPYYTNKREGTGLGLVTVQNIISGHKGKIDVSSQPGEGTCFTLILPSGM